MTLIASALASDMEAVLRVCPPYECPGTTDYAAIMSGAGCDCSGVPYAIFKRHGLSLYHGSNTIARKYTDGLTKLSAASQLAVGMAVYKWSASGSEPEKYRADGLGDFHHIGVVTSTNPLRIVHQSSAAGCTACDNSIKKWAYCGRLKGVQYDAADPQDAPDQQEVDGMYKVKVLPSALRIRKEPSTKADVLGSLPRNTIVGCSELKAGWYKLADSDGWISAQYCLLLEQHQVEDVTEGETSDDTPDWAQMIAAANARISELEDALVDAKTHYETNTICIAEIYERLVEIEEQLGIKRVTEEE